MHNETGTAPLSGYEAQGFFDSIRQHVDPNEACALARQAIANTTGRPNEAVRVFLASRYGREFAGEVTNALASGRDLSAAIDSAIERWMRSRISAEIEDELGIPQGLPTLTGFVCMHEALLETED